MAQTRQETSCRWAPYLAAKALGGMLRWLFDSLGRATPSRVCGHAIFPSTHSHIEAPSVTKAQPRPPLFHQKISAFHTPNQSIYAGGTCFTSFSKRPNVQYQLESFILQVNGGSDTIIAPIAMAELLFQRFEANAIVKAGRAFSRIVTQCVPVAAEVNLTIASRVVANGVEGGVVSMTHNELSVCIG